MPPPSFSTAVLPPADFIPIARRVLSSRRRSPAAYRAVHFFPFQGGRAGLAFPAVGKNGKSIIAIALTDPTAPTHLAPPLSRLASSSHRCSAASLRRHSTRSESFVTRTLSLALASAPIARLSRSWIRRGAAIAPSTAARAALPIRCMRPPLRTTAIIDSVVSDRVCWRLRLSTENSVTSSTLHSGRTFAENSKRKRETETAGAWEGGKKESNR